MTWFDEHWLRNAYDALKAMFDVEQHVKMAMIQFLYDEGFWDVERLSFDAAIARFNANLNPNKPEAWKIGELWAIASRFDRPQLFEAINADLGLETRRKPTEERRQDLQQRFVEGLERFNREFGGTNAALSRLEPPAEPQRPLPLTGNRPQFDLDSVVSEKAVPRNLP